MVRIVIMALAAISVALGLGTGAQAQRTPERIVAVGDLHGDYEGWMAIARDSGLVDNGGKWAGGRTTLVQLGDLADRGPDSLKIIRHLQKLQREAKRAGGDVIVLIGNHEAMMVSGDYRYVHPGEYEAFVDGKSKARRESVYNLKKAEIAAYYRALEPALTDEQVYDAWINDTPLGKVEHNTAWAPVGDLGKWAATLPAVAKVGETIFVHGGISANYALVPINEINRRVKANVVAGDRDLKATMNDQNGPLWYRGLALGSGAGGRPTAQNELDVALKAMGAKRMVIGHTPSLKGVITDFGGKLVRIDTGISSHYGGPLGWIEIRGDRVINHLAKRGN